MNTHLQITLVEPGTYKVKAVQGQVVTQQSIAVDQDYLERTGIDGTDLVREVFEILLQHEALAAVPAESTLEQLVAHYPYLSSELQKRFSPKTPEYQTVEAARITPIPAQDRPTHT
ncbi:MAG TPA: hypothetical protein VHU17_10075 [Acidimicrobiales bacterium]|nr:hypothetical protein [Acidimicrobiales bacterium]